jgi:hypothetical protein
MTQEDDPPLTRRFILLDEDRFTARMIQTLLPTLGEVTIDIHPTIEDAVWAAKRALSEAAGDGVILVVDLDGERRQGLALLKNDQGWGDGATAWAAGHGFGGA